MSALNMRGLEREGGCFIPLLNPCCHLVDPTTRKTGRIVLMTRNLDANLPCRSYKAKWWGLGLCISDRIPGGLWTTLWPGGCRRKAAALSLRCTPLTPKWISLNPINLDFKWNHHKLSVPIWGKSSSLSLPDEHTSWPAWGRISWPLLRSWWRLRTTPLRKMLIKVSNKIHRI